MLKKSIAIGIITSLIERGNAELSFLDLKGIDDLVDHPGASPLYGYVALKTYLPKRRFLGNYGSAERGLCLFKGDIATGLRKKNDCPLDANADLIQRLFPSPDGVNFVANQLNSDIVSRLTPLGVGRILGRLARVSDWEWSDKSSMEQLKSDLTGILFKSISEKRYLRSTSEVIQKKAAKLAKKDDAFAMYLRLDPVTFDEVVSQVRKLIKSIDTDTFENNLDGLAEQLRGAPRGVVNHVWWFIRNRVSHEDEEFIDKIRARLDLVVESNHAVAETIREIRSKMDRSAWNDFELLKIIKRRVQEVELEASAPGNESGEKKDFENFASVIVEAMRESRGAVIAPNDVLYPKYMPEHALLAFFIAKAESRKDLVSLFDGMPSLVKKKGWFQRTNRDRVVDEFLRTRWSLADVDPHFILHVEPRTEYFGAEWDSEFENEVREWGTEKRLFNLLALYMGSSDLPGLIPMGKVSLGTDEYSDCGETSLRNFFNIMLYDPKTQSFNTALFDILERADGEVSFDPAIRRFYDKYPTVDAGLVKDARQLWASTVVAGRQGVAYRKLEAEIRSMGSPDNMLELMGQLLFSGESRKEIREERWNKKTRNEKLDTLCEMFSTPARSVTWQEEESPTTSYASVKIKFKFNGEMVLVYVFEPGHFAVKTSGKPTASWLSMFLLEQFRRPPQDTQKYLIPLLIDYSSFEMAMDLYSLDPEFRVNLIFSRDLLNPDSQMRVFRDILRLIADESSELKFLARRVRSVLPEASDPEIALKIADTLYSYKYPLGYPTHLANRPDAVYRQVDETELVERFGAETAARLGRSFARRLFGMSELLIPDLLTFSDGNFIDLPLDAAAEACIELNSENDRVRVKEKIEARAEALRRFWSNKDSINAMDCSPDGPIARIHNNYPIRGFHLLSIEEYGCMFKEMGTQNLLTFPSYLQILPHLNKEAWVGSTFAETEYTCWNAHFSIQPSPKLRFGVRCGADL